MSEGELVDDGGNYDDDRWEEIGENSTWILSSAFMILTMQSGFALLEAGYSAPRNMTNVLMKRMVQDKFDSIIFLHRKYLYHY